MPHKIRILPRWLVFLLDLFLVCFCLFLSRMLKFNFNLVHVSVGLRFMLGVVLILNSVLFYLFKSYAGIVRYTNIEDTSRLVMINAISAFLYFAINIFILRSGNYFSLQVVTINFFITSFVISPTKPRCSARATKTSGPTDSPSSLIQRTSASAPTILFVSRLTTG